MPCSWRRADMRCTCTAWPTWACLARCTTLGRARVQRWRASGDGRRLAAAELGPGRQVAVFSWREVRAAAARVACTLGRGFGKGLFSTEVPHTWQLKTVLHACTGMSMQTCRGLAALAMGARACSTHC